ncbi:MAG: sensor histidine kinase [Bacteroidota bacterium]
METKETSIIPLTFFVGTISLLLLSGVIITIFIIFRKNLLNKEILLKAKESEHRLELLKNSIETTERERRRIAADLHDEINSKLSTLRLYIGSFKNSINPNLENIEECKNIVDQTSNSVRNISYNLSPTGLETFGLNSILTEMCNKLSEKSNIRFNCTTTNVDLKPFPEIEMALYRISQELITNSLKHGNPSTINICIHQGTDKVYLDYQDDGIGISSLDKLKKHGLGHKNIESRTAVFSGTFIYSSEAGKGFNAKIEIPLTK